MKAIFSIAVGNDECFKICNESQKRYAEKVGADYILRQNWHMPENDLRIDSDKRFVNALLLTYDEILYLDADVFIRKDADDIFEHYKNNKNVIIYNEVMHNDIDMDTPIQKAIDKHGLKWNKTNGHYDWLNSGVVLLSGDINLHRYIFCYEKERFFKLEGFPLCQDMPSMIERINRLNIPVTFMEEKFNTMVYFHDKGDFLHFANVHDRNERIKEYINE